MVLETKRPGSLRPAKRVAAVLVRNLGWLVAGFVVLTLTGCGKPPGCSDSETVKFITSSLADRVLPAQERFAQAGDPDGIISKFIESIQVDLTQVVSRGYDKEAKLQSCSATMSVKSSAGTVMSKEIDYSTQKTVDKDDFVMRISSFDVFAMATNIQLNEYFLNTRYAGQWRGTLSCGALEGEQTEASGPSNPFSQPVVLNGGRKGVMERVTSSGQPEKLNFDFNTGNGEVYIAGKTEFGAYQAQKYWSTEMRGTVTGKRMAAEGKTYTDRGGVRTCTIELTQGATSPTPGPAVLQPMPSVAISAPVEAPMAAAPVQTPGEFAACKSEWEKAYRKEAGQDAMIKIDIIEEWEALCRQGKKSN